VRSIALSLLIGCATAPAEDRDRILDARTITGDDTSVDDAAGQNKKGPPYPIVLAHGFFGFEDFAGAGFINYFYGVKTHLGNLGEKSVYTPAVDPFNSSEYRGKQLGAHIQKILADTNYAKVNIVGHSQGGLDARVVAHDHPDWIAAVVTVGTPHEGVPVADIALRIEPHSDAEKVIDALSKLAGRALYDSVGNETSMAAAIRQFATAVMRDFNSRYTNAFGVQYFSIAGRTALHPGGDDCAAVDSPDFIRAFATELDPTDVLLKPTETVLSSFGSYPNDGLVRARDARWGTFLGCVPADHLDQMGHLLGDSPGAGNTWKHLDFYAAIVRLLRARGL
jgi:triacylglycerol lipase